MGWFEVRDLTVGYGGPPVLHDVSLEIEPGELVAIIGANGAGKTTLMRAISGLRHPQRGEIVFEGRRIERMRPNEIVRLGIAHVPEGRRLFPSMTTRDNVSLGGYLQNRRRLPQARRELEGRFPILATRKRQKAGSLSGGEQQMVAICRGLMARPKLLLLDEPSVGLAPKLVRDIADMIAHIAGSLGVGVILVEQNAQLALRVASRAYVLDVGRIKMSGPADELMNDDRVRAAYLSA